MSYHKRRVRRPMSGLQSRPTGAAVSARAMAGLQSRPTGNLVSARAMGASPDWYRAMQGMPDWYRATLGTTLGDDTLAALPQVADGTPGASPSTDTVVMTEEAWRNAMLAEQRAVREWQERWVKADEQQRWIQIAVTASIPVFTAIWKMLGIGRRFTS